MSTVTRASPPHAPAARTARRLEYAVFLLALAGVLDVVHLLIQEGRGFDRGCTGFLLPEQIESMFDCGIVTASRAGRVFGVSIAVFGLIFYTATGLLTLLRSYAPRTIARPARRLRLLAAAAAFACAGYLVYYQTFVLREYCALCLISAAIVTVLFFTVLFEFTLRAPEAQLAMDAAPPNRSLRLHAVLAFLVLILIGADVTYFTRAGQAVPAPADGCAYDPARAPIEAYMELLAPGDPSKGNPAAAVTVVEIFEPNCSHCAALLPVLHDLATHYGDRARFYFVPVVFYPEPSYLQVSALYAAAEGGRYFEMLDSQFARRQRGGLPLSELQAIAREIGLDEKRLTERLTADAYRDRIVSQRHRIIETFGIRTVPTVLINGRTVATRSRECLAKLIEEAAGP